MKYGPNDNVVSYDRGETMSQTDRFRKREYEKEEKWRRYILHGTVSNKLEELEELKGKKLEGERGVRCEDKDDLRVAEAKVDESKQMDLAKDDKRVCTTCGGIKGTFMNLRIHEDTNSKEIARELLLGQSEMEVERHRAGRIIKGRITFENKEAYRMKR
ncbi:hypothetical protein L484_017065 [Morus notabilis]|uniref:Pre-mRNA-splicing factor SLU7 n=1 Tax=Morus notabilis TaxID=981085 RepID=W9S1J4_9ROSA|nr:hypothetical protein L484_017065 [Morus notabilis]